jgi:chemotaxis protein MotB
LRKKKHEEHVNHERWLVSYADFITLLFAFFVVMFAISQVDANKLGHFVESMNHALGIVGPSGNLAVLDGGDRASVLEGAGPPHGAVSRRAAVLMKRLEERLSGPSLQRAVSLRHDLRGVAVSLSEAGFFDSGQAALRPDSSVALHEVALALRDAGSPVAVEGHTDDRPIHNSGFASNWELSAARATTIVRYLIEQMAYDPLKLSATGFAEFRPVADNATPAGRALNRRVDLVLVTEGSAAPAPR